MAAHHVADMFLGQVVVCQVDRLVTLALEGGSDLRAFASALCAQAHKHMRLPAVADAVVKFGHAARPAGQLAHQLTKAAQAAPLLGDGHSKQRLALLTHFGAFGHKAQAIEIHIGAAQNGHIGLAFLAMPLCVLLDRRHR